MAFAGLRVELECSICLNTYNDPVTLSCGHNFCRVCIDCVLDTQERSGRYSCPECREKFQDRPALQRNLKLRNIVENFLSAQPEQEGSGVFCTYCVDSVVPAVKSCLLCEASLCNKHLNVHSKSPEHVLCNPTTSLQSRKCPVHKKILEYYCTEDSTCICMSCCMIGEHKGHEMQSLEVASDVKKKKLRNIFQELITKREKTKKKVKNLQKCLRNAQEQTTCEAERVMVLFRELKRRLEDLEKKVLSEVYRQGEQVSLSLSDVIGQLEMNMDHLSRRMGHIEELCNMTDPLTVLLEPDTADLCDIQEDDKRFDGEELDMFPVSHTFHSGLSDILTFVKEGKFIPEPADILLNVKTASKNLQISENRRIATWSENSQNRTETPETFQDYAQVMSSQSFSSGRHYWDVDVKGSQRVGVCYPSIERKGEQSLIGHNNKSWGIHVSHGLLFRFFFRSHRKQIAIHDNKEISLSADISIHTVRVYLDFEAGRISFYDVKNNLRHLYTFTATFTEPLHAAFWVKSGNVKISVGLRDVKAPPRSVTSQ